MRLLCFPVLFLSLLLPLAATALPSPRVEYVLAADAPAASSSDATPAPSSPAVVAPASSATSSDTIGPVIKQVSTAAPTTDTTIALVGALVQAIQHGQILLAVALGLMLIVFALRFVAGKAPDSGIGKVLSSRWGGWVLNFVLSLAGAIGTALAAGVPISGALVLTALVGSLTASGLWQLVSDALGAGKVATASSAGATAAAQVASKSDALKDL
jgi:hypothetical protein